MNKQNMINRSISGMIIVAIFIASIFLFRPLFYVLSYLVAALMLAEWYVMTKDFKFYHWLGQIIITVPIAALMLISYMDFSGWVLMTFFVIIWSVDTMAMVGGKLLGGPKLAPTISPKKTISGLVTGVLSAVIIVNIISFFPVYDLEISNVWLTILVLFIGLIAQASDLLISYFKRKTKIKDTGSIIPGHGGVLDRFDSIILTAPIIALFLMNNLF